MKKVILTCMIVLLSQVVHAELVWEKVPYRMDNTMMEGHFVYDNAIEGKRPAVMVVHDWMGPSEYSKKRAAMLAEFGYLAFEADIYGKDNWPQDERQAGEQATILKNDRNLMRKNAEAGLNMLYSHPLTERDKVAAIGYCFGGTVVLEMARAGQYLNGAVSFHGGLSTPTPEDAKNIRGKVLVLHGADDPFVPPEEVEGFKKEMGTAGVNYGFVAYPGAVHSFTKESSGTDVSTGAAYNAEADQQSWEEMKKFFDGIF